MAKKRRILLVALLVVVVGGIIWLCLQFAEPPEPVSYPKRPAPPTHDQPNEAISEDWSMRYPAMANNPDMIKIVNDALGQIESGALKNTERNN